MCEGPLWRAEMDKQSITFHLETEEDCDSVVIQRDLPETCFTNLLNYCSVGKGKWFDIGGQVLRP